MSITVKFEGGREFERAMDRLGQEGARDAALLALRDGAEVLRAAVEQKARTTFTRRKGYLFQGIKTLSEIARTKNGGTVVRFRIGIRKDDPNAPFYARFLELGWKPGSRKERKRAARDFALAATFRPVPFTDMMATLKHEMFTKSGKVKSMAQLARLRLKKARTAADAKRNIQVAAYKNLYRSRYKSLTEAIPTAGPYPFMAPAFGESARRAQDVVIASLQRLLPLEAERVKR